MAAESVQRRSGAQTRVRILDAAAGVMRERGIGRTTTKEIARAVGLSEAALYKHFPDKTELLMCVLRERNPQFIEYVAQLPGKVGADPVAQTLTELARHAVRFYVAGMPMIAALYAEPDLLARQRAELRAAGLGPHLANRGVADYLAAEQRLGRIAAGTDPYAAASLLVGACFQHAFLSTFMGPDLVPEPDTFAADLVRNLLHQVG
ncbi:MAG: TetR/AcrR family transcriptional regulator [Micromonosporaceae bacterium]